MRLKKKKFETEFEYGMELVRYLSLMTACFEVCCLFFLTECEVCFSATAVIAELGEVWSIEALETAGS